MSFLDIAKKRFSVRVYDAKAVPDEVIDMVLEAARIAPSAANRQPLHFVVLKDPDRRHSLGVAYPRDWFWKSPVIIVVCVDTARAWMRADNKNYGDVDAAIAMDHMTLCAADLGLGTCWIAAFDPAKVSRILNLPEGINPLAMTPLGYPAEPIRAKSRKTLAEMVHQETW